MITWNLCPYHDPRHHTCRLIVHAMSWNAAPISLPQSKYRDASRWKQFNCQPIHIPIKHNSPKKTTTTTTTTTNLWFQTHFTGQYHPFNYKYTCEPITGQQKIAIHASNCVSYVQHPNRKETNTEGRVGFPEDITIKATVWNAVPRHKTYHLPKQNGET